MTKPGPVEQREVHKKENSTPETKGVEDGSSKRNIIRKHNLDPHVKAKPQHGGGGGKGKWNELDDGTLDEEL
eukprot:CAMPEP_0172414440 /NCGR_PEP_ID=MMETSP1064-20121228/1098_1 /TAXON_ID=202472 /ORGANISM="Aulacoseira subarctica , Strain CCAP 1002/5" /LENGTH=71 /DNA_ID=CAMNT_0013151107 /DNA_START=116 /DNA_END=331 /DNA_ORIENTATION=+